MTPDVLALEDIMSDGWWPLEHEWDGRWLLRASEGLTGRGNSALPLGTPSRPLKEAIDGAAAFYLARGQRPMFAVPLPLEVTGHDDGGPLASELVRRGYRVHTPALVMTARSVAVAAQPPRNGHAPVELLTTPDDDWRGLYRYRGRSLPPVAEKLLMSAPDVRFAALRLDGTAAAVGRIAVSRGWGGITAMEVAPAYRRRGYGHRILTALAEYAGRRDAEWLYLQVAEDNVAAQNLFARAGFRAHHRYHYRVLD
ncbi:MAG: GNAT family N-acetyltransferase [Propionibacteriales bacterium]|nr:GNAT family N-acetyltransferase [Propionibacteriales bacterium]